VVLAAWEEVRTVGRVDGADEVSEFGPGPASGSAGQDHRSPSGQASGDNTKGTRPAASRYTFTQLILRVVPASSNPNSSQPAMSSVRDGWFVIQL
jgi:hypothetical protein